MTGNDVFRYDGKLVLIVGGATGIGAAVARSAMERRAEVVLMDHAPWPRRTTTRPTPG